MEYSKEWEDLGGQTEGSVFKVPVALTFQEIDGTMCL